MGVATSPRRYPSSTDPLTPSSEAAAVGRRVRAHSYATSRVLHVGQCKAEKRGDSPSRVRGSGAMSLPRELLKIVAGIDPPSPCTYPRSRARPQLGQGGPSYLSAMTHSEHAGVISRSRPRGVPETTSPETDRHLPRASGGGVGLIRRMRRKPAILSDELGPPPRRGASPHEVSEDRRYGCEQTHDHRAPT